MNIWLVMIIIGVLTFLTRLSFIALQDKWQMPDIITSALKYVPTAVLTAIIVPELLLSSGTLNVSFGNARLVAGMLAGLVAWRTKNVTLTISVGMLALWLFQLWFLS
jgi:branched-subunit amino acid transport protein